MRKIAFILLGLVLAFGIYIMIIVNEKFEFVDQAIIESRVSTDNKSMTAQKIELRKPDNSIGFFKDLKMKSEEYWKTIELNKDVYGFQTQKGTLWNKGLTEEQIDSFETEVGIEFPEGLKNYYRVMNGVNLPAINIYGDSGEKSTYSNNFYSYPEDITKIKETIQWIYDSNNVTAEDLNEKGISRIFPVFGHRFLLVDDDDGLILSMHGDDIIYWTDKSSLHAPIEPQMYVLKTSNKVFIKISNGIPAGMKHIEECWGQVFPDSPFAYRFIDDALQDVYKGDQIRGKVFFLLSLLTIFIAFLGLFGLASYLASQRVKEIGIRKVFGATLKNIVFLITSDFLLLALIAAIPAFILSWYIMNRWLENFAFRTEINYSKFVLSLLFTLLLTFITTSLHAWRATSVNPLKNLRSE